MDGNYLTWLMPNSRTAHEKSRLLASDRVFCRPFKRSWYYPTGVAPVAGLEGPSWWLNGYSDEPRHLAWIPKANFFPQKGCLRECGGLIFGSFLII